MNLRIRLCLLVGALLMLGAAALFPSPDPADAVLPVVAPTTGWVTQEFGGCSTDGQCHAAIDIAGPPTLPGAPVYSMAAGKVIQRIQQNHGYGCHIVIDHGNQGDGKHLYSLYSHLGWKNAQGTTQGCYFDVALNQNVGLGQQIGKQGNSGLATGTHVHFAVFSYPPPWSGSHHAIDPRQCIGFAQQYVAKTTGVGCGPGTCPHDLADSCLLRALPSNRTFVFFGGAKFHVPPSALSSLYSGKTAWDVSDLYADSLTQKIPRDGTLLRDSSNGRVYVIAGGARFHIPNANTLKGLYCPLYPAVKCDGILWHDAISGIPVEPRDGSLLHDVSNGKVHVIIGGARFHVPDISTLRTLYCPAGTCWTTLWHEAAEAIPTNPRDRTLIRDNSNGKVHVLFGGARFHVPSPAILQSLYCPTYPQPGCWRELWHEGAEGIATIPRDDTTLREQTSGTVWAFCDGRKWNFPSATVFNAIGYDWSKVGVLWAGALNFSLGANTDVRVNPPGDRLCDPADADDDNDTLSDTDESALWMTDPLKPDTDGDGSADHLDNCPAWFNPGGAAPVWPVNPIDSDCDGFTSVAEARLGTNPARQCALTVAPDDEPVDAWPTDLNDDRITNETDVALLRPAYNTSEGAPGFNPRYDLNGDRLIDVLDLTMFGPFLGKTCS